MRLGDYRAKEINKWAGSMARKAETKWRHDGTPRSSTPSAAAMATAVFLTLAAT